VVQELNPGFLGKNNSPKTKPQTLHLNQKLVECPSNHVGQERHLPQQIETVVEEEENRMLIKYEIAQHGYCSNHQCQQLHTFPQFHTQDTE
jgi:hypothetical protein